MSGHVYYRFKSQKEPLRITFDGVGISVFDLKREIILNSKLGKGSEFDFALFSADGQDEYKNDHTVIPRSTTVIAQRRPPKKPGQGNAQMYIAEAAGPSRVQATPHADWRGGGSITKDFRSKDAPKPEVTSGEPGSEQDAEAQSMAAMFAAQEQQWQETQESMATATRVGRNYGFRDRQPRPGNGDRDRPRREFSGPRSAVPPEGYICYRCGSKAHWIQDCPNNDDPELAGKPRIKRTTGIPKSFLQKIEGKPEEGQNVMVMPDGTLVVARPDDASWQQHKAVALKNLTAADIQNLQPSDPDLACSICTKLLKDAVKTPCCGSSFCDVDIRTHLREHAGVCPECESKVQGGVRGLIVDEDRRQRSKDYVDDLLRAGREAAGRSSDDEDDKQSEATREGDQNGTPLSTKAASLPPDSAEKGTLPVPSEETRREGSRAPSNREGSAAPAAPEMGSARSANGHQPDSATPASQPDGAQQQAATTSEGTFDQTSMSNGAFGAMNGGQGVMMMNGGAVNPAMLHQQMMHNAMMLQNPTLPQPMRMQLMMAQQQLGHQMMMIQQSMGGGGMYPQQQQPGHFFQAAPPQQPLAQRNPNGNFRGGRGGGAPGGGGRGGRFNLSDFQQRLQQQQGVSAPAANGNGAAYQRQPQRGRRFPGKRERSADAIELAGGDAGPPEKTVKTE